MIVPEASYVALQRKMTNIRVSPLVCWAMMHQQQCPDWEKIVRDTLAEHGIDFPLLECISHFSIDRLSWLVSLLDEPSAKPMALRAVNLIARAYKDNHDFYWAYSTYDQVVERIFEALKAIPCEQKHDDELGRLLHLWIKSSDHPVDEFEKVLTWWVKNMGLLTFDADWTWKKVVRQYLRLASWKMPQNIPDEINGVTIRSLATGAEFIEHSLQMGKDLDATDVFYEIGYAVSNERLFFHLYKTSNPSICATLSFSPMFDQYMSCDEDWQPGDFQTVGGGTPPAILAEAAEKLIEILRKNETGWSSELDCDGVNAA